MPTPAATPVDQSGWYSHYRALVSERLQELFAPLDHPVYDLCAYHMGWRDQSGRSIDGQGGKMLRPVLCLVGCQAYGEPERAVGVAAALETLHAFSLVHDDIEDGDRERRHRPTLWSLHGVPLALNAGDALFALAYKALHEAALVLPRDTATLASRMFSDACLRIIEGQHLDIEFESRAAVSTPEYVEMARRKTGTLIGASLALGALFGGARPDQVERFDTAGVELGLAFQATDDVLAVWGDPAQTGKAIGNDLARGKKSLPLVQAAERGLDLARLAASPLLEVRAELERAGVRGATEQFASDRAREALRLIAVAEVSTDSLQQLTALVEFVTGRDA